MPTILKGTARYRKARDYAYAGSVVELPWLCPDVNYVPKSLADVTHSPADGTALQSVLAAIAGTSGDVVIKLTAGTRYTGNFIFPVRSGRTYVYSSKVLDGTLMASYPPSQYAIGGTQTRGSRISHPLSYAVAGGGSPLAQMATSAYIPAVSFAVGAKGGYRFEGVEIMQTEAVTTVIESGLVNTGGPDDTYVTSFANVPENINFGHFLIHGRDSQQIRRGVLQNGFGVGFRDGSVYGIHRSGTESAGIAGWNTPGKAAHINCLISGGAQDVLYGGAGPVVPGLIGRNFTSRWNHFWKDPAKFTWVTGGTAPNYGWKNHYEHKNHTHILLEDCAFEHLTSDGQNGSNILFQCLNDNNIDPAMQRITDITMRNLYVYGGGPLLALIGLIGYSLGGEPIIIPELPTARVLMEQVYAEQIAGVLEESRNASGGFPAGHIIQLSNVVTDTMIRHITAEGRDAGVIFTGQYTGGLKVVRPTIKDSLIGRGHYGSLFDTEGNGQGSAALAFDTDTPTIQNNVFYGNQVEGGDNAANYPTGNFYPAAAASVGFSSYAQYNPGALSTGSAYHNAATDGTDIGCNKSAIDSMKAAVRTPTADLPTGVL